MGNGLNDQQWHSVRLVRRATQVSLQVDNESPVLGKFLTFCSHVTTHFSSFLCIFTNRKLSLYFNVLMQHRLLSCLHSISFIYQSVSLIYLTPIPFSLCTHINQWGWFDHSPHHPQVLHYTPSLRFSSCTIIQSPHCIPSSSSFITSHCPVSSDTPSSSSVPVLSVLHYDHLLITPFNTIIQFLHYALLSSSSIILY